MSKRVIGIILLLLVFAAIVFTLFLAGGTETLAISGIAEGLAVTTWIAAYQLTSD